MNNIIKNKVMIFGTFDEVISIKKDLRSEKSQIDFNKIEPMEEDVDDLELNDYLNLCLNIYINNNKDLREKLISTFKFVGKTRMYPYEFTELTADEISNVKEKYKIRKMQSDTKLFLEKIKSKSIFNGYMIRDALWGTGSNPFDIRINENTFTFKTFDKAPIKVFEKLSKKYPKVKIDYTYQIGQRNTKLRIIDGKITTIENQNTSFKEPRLFDLISENVFI